MMAEENKTGLEASVTEQTVAATEPAVAPAAEVQAQPQEATVSVAKPARKRKPAAKPKASAKPKKVARKSMAGAKKSKAAVKSKAGSKPKATAKSKTVKAKPKVKKAAAPKVSAAKRVTRKAASPRPVTRARKTVVAKEEVAVMASSGKRTRSTETPAKGTPEATGIAAAAMEGAASAKPAKGKAARAPKSGSPAKAMGNKAPVRKSVPGPRADVPLIDTNLVAQQAAAMVLHKDLAPEHPQPEEKSEGKTSEKPEEPKHESSTFKHMKEQLAHPKPAALANLLGPVGGQKKSGGNFFGNQQKGHNQTFGGFNKTGVPRRTNG